MKKELIGYNYKSDRHKKAFGLLADLDVDTVNKVDNCDFQFKSVIFEKMCNLGILDQFSDPVYEQDYPILGQEYKHENGNIYVVLHVTNTASSNPNYVPQVVYQGRNGNVWSRPLSEWNEKFILVS